MTVALAKQSVNLGGVVGGEDSPKASSAAVHPFGPPPKKTQGVWVFQTEDFQTLLTDDADVRLQHIRSVP
jgi:hypothetical protein